MSLEHLIRNLNQSTLDKITNPGYCIRVNHKGRFPMAADILLLTNSAKEVGKYLIQHEWDTILECGEVDQSTFDTFKKGIKDRVYYHALVCHCKGEMEEVDKQLKFDYEEYKKEWGNTYSK